MISLDLAPNDSLSDALTSFSLIFQPWRWIKGSQVLKTKSKLKRFFPGHEMTFYLSARGALYKLFQTLDLKRGDEIAVLGFTCEAVILPITTLGFVPLYIDSETESFSMSLTHLKKKAGKKTKVILLQHTYGATPKFRDEIIKFAEKSNIIVVEDLAHGFDETLFKKDASDTIKLFSFGREKALSSVFGGAIFTMNKQLSDELKRVEKRLLRPKPSFIFRCLLYKPVTLIIKKTYDLFYLGKVLHWTIETLRIFPKEVTFQEKEGTFNPTMASLYPNALAALLNQQLKKFESIQMLRRKNVKEYNAIFHSLDSTQPLSRYPVMVEGREALMKQAGAKHIYLSRWYPVLMSPAGECPNAEILKDVILNLPTHTKQDETRNVIKKVEVHNFHMQHSAESS